MVAVDDFEDVDLDYAGYEWDQRQAAGEDQGGGHSTWIWRKPPVTKGAPGFVDYLYEHRRNRSLEEWHRLWEEYHGCPRGYDPLDWGGLVLFIVVSAVFILIAVVAVAS